MSHCDEETLSLHGSPFRNMWLPGPDPPHFVTLSLLQLSVVANVLRGDELLRQQRVWAGIIVDMKVSLPMALSLCSDRCRSVTVCCFGTKITHVHHSCHVNGFIIGNKQRGVALQPLSACTHLYFCNHNSPISCQSQLSEKDGVRGQLWELSPSGHRGSVPSSSRISP